MSKQTWMTILVAALFICAAAAAPGTAHARPARRPARQEQASSSSHSSTSKARKKRISSKSTSSRSRKKSKAKGQAAPTSDRVKEIQSALQREGVYEGEPTGKWDDATAEAMRKYQDKNGFNPTGKIDARSLEKLGLGSQTAGKAAPVANSAGTAPAASAGNMSTAGTGAPSAGSATPPADPK